jgi:hypothetical protein
MSPQEDAFDRLQRVIRNDTLATPRRNTPFEQVIRGYIPVALHHRGAVRDEY